MIKTSIVKVMVERQVAELMPALDLASELMILYPALKATMRIRFDMIRHAVQSLSSQVDAQGPFTDADDVRTVIAAEVEPIATAINEMLEHLRDLR